MRGQPSKPEVVEQAEQTGLTALVFLTQDEDRLGRFLGDTGLSPDDLRASAGTHAGLVAVLDYVLADESMLLLFAAGAAIDPAAVGPARDVLAGGSDSMGYAAAHGARPAQQQPKRPSRRWEGPGSDG